MSTFVFAVTHAALICGVAPGPGAVTNPDDDRIPFRLNMLFLKQKKDFFEKN